MRTSVEVSIVFFTKISSKTGGEGPTNMRGNHGGAGAGGGGGEGGGGCVRAASVSAPAPSPLPSLPLPAPLGTLLHTGQLACPRSHASTQPEWNSCLQGSRIRSSSPRANSQQQTTQPPPSRDGAQDSGEAVGEPEARAAFWGLQGAQVLRPPPLTSIPRALKKKIMPCYSEMLTLMTAYKVRLRRSGQPPPPQPHRRGAHP